MPPEVLLLLFCMTDTLLPRQAALYPLHQMLLSDTMEIKKASFFLHEELKIRYLVFRFDGIDKEPQKQMLSKLINWKSFGNDNPPRRQSPKTKKDLQ